MTTIDTKRIGSYTALGSKSPAGKAFERINAFLEAHRRHLVVLQEMGRPLLAVENHRLAAFSAYAERHGFKVAA